VLPVVQLFEFDITFATSPISVWWCL